MEPVGYLALVRSNANYRSLWIGEIISLFGDWFNLIASALDRLCSAGIQPDLFRIGCGGAVCRPYAGAFHY